MNDHRGPQFVKLAPPPIAGEAASDFRERALRQQAETAQRRQQDLLELSSQLNPPETRIRIWESLHQVSLPRSAEHRLLTVIARATGLTLDQVLEAQRNRFEPPPAVEVPAEAV